MRLRITRPGAIGRVNTWTIRAPKSPKLVRRCVQPGAKKPSRCPADQSSAASSPGSVTGRRQAKCSHT